MNDVAKQLQLGQNVQLGETESGYQIAVLSPDKMGHKVVGVGHDFVVLEDPATEVKVRIPGHLLKFLSAPAQAAPAAPSAQPMQPDNSLELATQAA
jgi:hypothetical protein